MQTRSIERLHLVRIDVGEKIIECLTAFIKERDIQSGFITGIGATSHATIAWYDVETGEYITTEIDEICELTSLVGNISWFEGQPMIHAHVTLGKRDYSIIGGHLIEAVIGVTGEFWIHSTPIKIVRTLSQFKKIKLIDFDAK